MHLKIIDLIALTIIALLMPTDMTAAELNANAHPRPVVRETNTISATHMGRMELFEVPPTAASKPFFSSYVIETSGYRQATISLFGTVETTTLANCRVGVIMLPKEKAIIDAWKKHHYLGLVDEISTGVSIGDKYFQGQLEVDIKFPAYILGFYNTCNSQIVLNLYSYLK